MRLLFMASAAAAAFLVFMTGCQGEFGNDGLCDPGETRPCECTEGAEGQEICRDDGSGWSACNCVVDGSTDVYPDPVPDPAGEDPAVDPLLDTPPEAEADAAYDADAFEEPDEPVPCAPAPGILDEGETFMLEVDGHTGDEATTEPKTDANDGANGDNPQFRRHNVARAHIDYWYTSSYQEAGEPDPDGEQWVDYTPDFTLLGVGCYHIVARYRATESRATYAALYQIRNADGLVVQLERVQERGSGEYRDEDLGHHVMCPDSYVRIEDPGASSITFNQMQFTYVGESCP
jgi:hypothetical protein